MKKENKKALIVTSVASMIDQFLMPSIELLISMGYKVTIGSNYIDGSTCDRETIERLKKRLTGLGAECVQIDFDRNVFGVNNHLRAYRQLKKTLNEDNYDLIHCHSPIGGLLTRIAVPRRHNGKKVIYTAHGFHFYKGASIKNWLIYYPIEKLCSYNTDILITINKEDFSLARKKLKAGETLYIPGVGIKIDTESLPEDHIREFKEKRGIKPDETMLLSVGELNKNKNHITVIKALEMLYAKRPEIKWQYFICGKGGLDKELDKYIYDHNLSERIHLVGFTKEIRSFLSSAALFIHPSYREGLSVALMEAIAAGVPVICSDIRGNQDLVAKENLFDPADIGMLEKKIENFFDNDEINRAAIKNKEALKKCSIESVSEQLKKIYAE